MTYNGYNISIGRPYALYIIKNIGQGPVPNQLKGGFSSAELAMKEVDSYLRKKGSKKGAKSNIASTG